MYQTRVGFPSSGAESYGLPKYYNEGICSTLKSQGMSITCYVQEEWKVQVACTWHLRSTPLSGDSLRRCRVPDRLSCCLFLVRNLQPEPVVVRNLDPYNALARPTALNWV